MNKCAYACIHEVYFSCSIILYLLPLLSYTYICACTLSPPARPRSNSQRWQKKPRGHDLSGRKLMGTENTVEVAICKSGLLPIYTSTISVLKSSILLYLLNVLHIYIYLYAHMYVSTCVCIYVYKIIHSPEIRAAIFLFSCCFCYSFNTPAKNWDKNMFWYF